MQNRPTFPEDPFHPLVTFILMWLAQNGAFLLLAWMIYSGFTLIPTLLLISLAASWWALYQTA